MTAPTSDRSPPVPGTAVKLDGVTIRAGERVLLDRASAVFEPGKVTLIVGPSGVGKSLLLRVIAGGIRKTHPGVAVTGRVLLGDREVPDAETNRSVGVVFQNFALFDELSPLDNVRFARAHRVSRNGEAATAPQTLLEELRVPQGVRTASLSGGQQQRLAIARTLAYDPDVILYDEPTSGLDAVTAVHVADLIRNTHAAHPKTSIIVTHDYESLPPIADAIYVLDPQARTLRRLEREDWPSLRNHLAPASVGETVKPAPTIATRVRGGLIAGAKGVANFFAASSRAAEQAVLAPLRLLPWWRSPAWGFRYLLHYLGLVGGASAWLYIAVAGLIIGFVTTHFTFKFLPYAGYTEPLLIEDLLNSMGFALYRILVPVLVTILVAARCGAAVASDVGGKTFGQQTAALRSFGARPERYLLTGILWAFLVGTPVLVAVGFFVAKWTSLVVFTATHPERGPSFWELHFHQRLRVPGELLYDGTWWLLAKVLLCAAGIALIAYHSGARPKFSSRDVSRGITSSILWSTLYVLVVHFAFTFFEFD